MDFESGIDTWVIDKEESDVSQNSFEKSRKDVQSLEMKAMDKENIKQFKSSCDKKSLRYFRIRKHVGYHELTSESDSDSKKKSPVDKNDFPCRRRIQTLHPSPVTLNDKAFSNFILHRTSSNSSLNSLKEVRKDKESLTAEEIAISLSESEGSCDSIQEKNRERLHAIENVSGKVDSKDKCNENSPTALKSSFTCSICNFECHSLGELSVHESTHRRGNLLNTQQTSENVVKKLQIQRPLDNTGPEWNKHGFLDTFKNHLINRGVIPENFTDSKRKVNEDSEAEERISVPTMKKSFKCNMCNYFSPDMVVLKSHQILFHSQSKILACEYCDYKTSQCASLATHIRVHFKLDCPHCEFQCSLKENLERHLMQYHVDSNCYKCKKCDYSCKSQNKYHKHLQLHAVSKKYQCADCSVFFTNKQILKLHIKQHTALKNSYKCAQCHMCFTQKKLLKHHVRSHEQLFVCNTCNSKFTQKSFLRIHMKVHNRVVLKCEKCNSEFTRKNYLKLHMRIHLPKNSKCEHCPFQCTDSHELSKHICINKLYDVQKRSLNFHREDLSSDTRHEDEGRRVNSNMKTMPNETIKSKNIINIKKMNLGIYQKKKHRKNRLKLLSLRQNLPSRNNQILIEHERGRRNGELPRSAKGDVKSKQTTYKIKSKKKNVCTDIKNCAFKAGTKQNTWVVKDNLKKGVNKLGKKVKKEQLTRWFDCAKVLFDNKPLPKELYVEPVRFVMGTFVQCYYQSQQSATVQEHIERHVQQNTLLSCRFCKYKTNSDQLLQRHNAKNHTWDPVVVNKLFS